MKIVYNGDNFTLFILGKHSVDIATIKKDIKDNILKLRKRYRKSISGFYDVKVYINDKIGMILDFNKEDDLEFFKDVIDVNVVVCENSNIFLKLNELFLFEKMDKLFYLGNDYYINVDDISLNEFYNVLEFSEFIYGDKLDSIENCLNLLIKNASV